MVKTLLLPSTLTMRSYNKTTKKRKFIILSTKKKNKLSQSLLPRQIMRHIWKIPKSLVYTLYTKMKNNFHCIRICFSTKTTITNLIPKFVKILDMVIHFKIKIGYLSFCELLQIYWKEGIGIREPYHIGVELERLASWSGRSKKGPGFDSQLVFFLRKICSDF